MNMIFLTGNIGAEPEFRRYENGKRQVSFSVALNHCRKNGEPTETIWIQCLAWDSVSDGLSRCNEKMKLSGRKICLIGTFAQRIWTDQASGKKRTKLMVNVLRFDLVCAGIHDLDLDPAAGKNSSAVEELFDGKPLFQRRKSI